MNIIRCCSALLGLSLPNAHQPLGLLVPLLHVVVQNYRVYLRQSIGRLPQQPFVKGDILSIHLQVEQAVGQEGEVVGRKEVPYWSVFDELLQNGQKLHDFEVVLFDGEAEHGFDEG